MLDGEILPWKEGRPLPFSELQRRIGRKKLGRRLLTEVPTAFLAYDVLEFGGEDVRAKKFSQRREILSQVLTDLPESRLSISPVVAARTWQELDILRAESRRRGVEGFMLKRLDSAYQVGRRRGDWWKWKIDPLTVDAVLILVFEIAFEGIQESSRHKSVVAVRFPRIARWRRDKKTEAADTIETLKSLLSKP